MAYLYKKLDNKKEIIKSSLYPKKFNNSCKNSVALIGIGGNIGDVKRRFEKLLFKFKKDKLVKVLATSIIFKNPPFGYLEQNYFYNSLILIDTKLSPIRLLKYLQRVEYYFRRKREFKDGPRTLDLDIIFYEKKEIAKGTVLIVPHPNWQDRESVLLPLGYLKGAKCLKRVLSHQHQKRHIN